MPTSRDTSAHQKKNISYNSLHSSGIVISPPLSPNSTEQRIFSSNHTNTNNSIPMSANSGNPLSAQRGDRDRDGLLLSPPSAIITSLHRVGGASGNTPNTSTYNLSAVMGGGAAAGASNGPSNGAASTSSKGNNKRGGGGSSGTPSPVTPHHSVAHNAPNPSFGTKLNKFHAFMDRQCKWIVSTMVFGVCLANTYVDARTVVVPYFILSALATAMAGKGLKKILKQSRPAGAARTNYGMPSSHAVSLGFLSTAVCVAGYVQLAMGGAAAATTAKGGASSSSSSATILFGTSNEYEKVLYLGAQCIVALGSGMYFSLLRIRHDHHTLAQVAVGYAFGFSCCVATAMLNYSQWSPQGAILAPNNSSLMGGRVDDERFLSAIGRVYLNAVFVMGSVGFGVRYCRRWLKEKGTSLARKPQQNELFSPTTANPSFLHIQPNVDPK